MPPSNLYYSTGVAKELLRKQIIDSVNTVNVGQGEAILKAPEPEPEP